MRRAVGTTTLAIMTAMSLVACGSDSSTPSADGSITLTLSGWSIATTPEFQLLADGFNKANPGTTVTVKEYDATQYNTQVTTDLAAGTGPDIITQKEVKFVPTFAGGDQLLDVSDVALPAGIGGADSYKVDGKQYAVPYRMDSWVLFYNKDLFDKAKVAQPDGSWTWDDYTAADEKLTAALGAGNSGVHGSYQHSWQSTVQGFASAQSKGADILSGKFSYLKPYYERALALQQDKSQIDFNTVKANSLTYQGQFGTQKAAMMPMGSWYVATLISQQAKQEADDFTWGVAPIPQFDSSTTGTDKTPVTFGDPSGFGINANIDAAKQAAAKKFLAYAISEAGQKSLAAIGISPALQNPAVVDTYFAVKGVPTDALTKFAISQHDTKPENPTSSKTAAIQTILGDLHTAVMSGSTPIDKAITDAEARFTNEGDNG